MENNKSITYLVTGLLIVFCVYIVYKYQLEEDTCTDCVASKPSKVKIYNFNTSTCPASKQFQPIWDEFSKRVKKTNVDAIDIKCDNPKYQNMCAQYKIEAVPSVVLSKGSQNISYNGSRSVNDLLHFINSV